MEITKIWNGSASDKQLKEIASRLKQGEIGIIPTDTVYAIVGDALNSKTVDRICRLKGIKPEKTNLSIICDGISMASEYSRIENTGFRLMKDHCPGPFTFLFRTISSLPKAFKGRKTVGIRIPDYQFARDLSEALGNPLITTSIEYEDDDHAINQDLIAETYEGRVDFMISDEEGRTDVSTIIDCTGNEPVVIRQGLGNL